MKPAFLFSVPAKFEYQGQVRQLEARVSCVPDESPDLSFLSESQLEAIESGSCEVLGLIVEVSFAGEITGLDSLGGVFLYNGDVADLKSTVKDHDMIQGALNDLKNRLDNVLAELA